MTAESGAGLSGIGDTNRTGRNLIGVWAAVLDINTNPVRQNKVKAKHTWSLPYLEKLARKSLWK
jgi:hypothetical protein